MAALRRQRSGAALHIGTRGCSPEINGGVEHFNRSLKFEHLYQREIDHAATLAEEVEESLKKFNEVRPHEPLGQRIPLSIHRGDQHLFGGQPLQEG